MCLINNKTAVEKFLAKPYKAKLIKAYKIVERGPLGEDLFSKVYSHKWHIGTNYADKVEKKTKGPYKTDYKIINNAIHVYLSKKNIYTRRLYDKIITVWVRKEDLLDVSASGERAAFRKVVFRKAEYNRAIA